jgi:hypothetical protein
MSAPKKNIGNKQWDVYTTTLKTAIVFGFGIERANTTLAWEIIGKQNNPNEEVQSQLQDFTFTEFQTLLRILHEESIDTTDVNAALDTYHKKKEDANKSNLDREYQIFLNSFFSPHTPNPMHITVDGKWGPQSEKALKFVIEHYKLNHTKRDTAFLGLLKTISSRLFRVACNDDDLLSSFSPMPFLIIDNNYENYELKKAGQGIALFEPISKTEKVYIENYFSNDYRTRGTLFGFGTWMTLLNMEMGHKNSTSYILIQIEDQNYVPFNMLEYATVENGLIPPQRSIKIPFYGTKINLAFEFVPEIEIIAISLSNSFQVDFNSKQERKDIGKSDKLIVSIDTDFFSNELITQTIVSEYNTNYLKVFLLNKNRIKNDKEVQFNLPANTNVFDILSLRNEDILSVYTMELNFVGEEKKEATVSPKAFHNKWVLVVGTGDETYTPEEKRISEALGIQLANEGYGIICGGWSGVDNLITNAFHNQLKKSNFSTDDRLLFLIEQSQQFESTFGTIDRLKKGMDWYSTAVNKAVAVIVIGGRGGSSKTADYAIKNNIPVIPIPKTGGDAIKLFMRLMKNKKKTRFDMLLPNLKKDLETENQITDVCSTVIALLETIDKKLSTTKEDFKTIVQKIYNDRKIIVRDDLQKNRWGGESLVNNKEITATVKKSKIPFIYTLNLTVRSINKNTLTGKVAFFLHNTFADEIIIKDVEMGVAELSVKTYEAFTVGAYTEDGSSLELDLNEQPGFPKGFYYTDIPPAFIKEVETLYKKTKVKVEDDLQKNRWGGKVSSARKQIRATVTDAITPGFYKVEVEVVALNSNVFTGTVAFFIHDTFGEEIKFRKVIDRKAKLIITAYEAFTIGAYLSDGTQLELDLQLQKGFPKGFYYKD